MRFNRLMLPFVVVMIGITVSTVAAVGQERSRRPPEPLTVRASSAETPLAEPSGEATQAIALTLWALTIGDANGPEADELEGALRDKAKNLSTDVGSVGDVRELVAKLKVAGLLKKYREIRLTTVDGQVVTAQSGADQPSVVGTQFSQQGTTNMLQMRAVGTMVRAIAKLDKDGRIQVGLDYNSSRVEKSERVNISQVKEREPLAADVVTSMQVNTLVSVAPGRAVVVSGDATMELTPEDSNGETQLLVLAAEIVD
jgi:hypothetical protein